MNTTCRACLNYTDNGVRLLTLYKHFHYLPIMIWNCIGIRVSQCAYIHAYPLLFSVIFFYYLFQFLISFHYGVYFCSMCVELFCLFI